MTTVGLYLGTAGDPVKNVEKQLVAWGEYLNEFDLETFGSASLPEAAESYYSHIETTHRDPTLTLSRIYHGVRDTQEYLAQRSPDVLVQLWQYPRHAFGVCLVGNQNDIPVITRLSGDVFETFNLFSGIRRLYSYMCYNVLGRYPVRHSDALIALGPNGAATLRSYGAPDSAVTVLPPAPSLDDRFTLPDNKTERQVELGLDPERRNVLFVGRLTELKGMSFLRKVIDLSPASIQFVLVGDGPQRSDLRQAYSKERLRMPGHVPYEEIHCWYQAADIYFHPSPNEGLPLVLLEALNCGVPVIAREAGDVGYVTPYVVTEPAEAVDLLTEDLDPIWCNQSAFDPDRQGKILRNVVSSLA